MPEQLCASEQAKSCFHLNSFQEDHRKTLLFRMRSDFFFFSVAGTVGINKNKVFPPTDTTIILLKIRKISKVILAFINS